MQLCRPALLDDARPGSSQLGSIEVAMLGFLTIIQGVTQLLDGVVGLGWPGTLIEKMGTSAIAEGRKT